MAQPPTVMPQDMMHHPQGIPPPVSTYYPENGGDLTGGLPINLDSLRDGPPGSKPFYPYSTLIRYAIKGAPNQKLLLEDIYYAIESRFPYFRTAPPGWKNSVRHNLSLNPCFEKVPRPLTDRGKGSYWTVNDNVDPRTGVHRVRKKKSKGSKSSRGQQQVQQEPQSIIEEDVDYHPAMAPPPPPPDAAGPSRQQAPPPAYPPPYPPPFDPTFSIMPPTGMYRMPPFFEDQFDSDENGNPNWHGAWRKELQSLVQMTEEQEKAGVDQEWYRMMLFRLRSGFLAPAMNPGDGVVHVGGAPHGMPGQPTNPGDVPQE
ncbi:hypothetical protein ABKN59_000561 [Abortiporus biennis]